MNKEKASKRHKLALVHTNSHLYAPQLGRILSAAPLVAEPWRLDNDNRYPLNGPSGYSCRQN